MGGMHGMAEPSGTLWVVVVLRLVLLLSTSVVAGIGLMRPAAEVVRSRTRFVAWVASAIAAVAAVLSIPLAGAGIPFAVGHALLAVAIPAALTFPTPSAFLGFGLGLLLLAETSIGHASLDFLLDLLCTAGGLVWLGLAVLANEVGAGKQNGLRTGPLALTIALAIGGSGIARVLTSDVVLDRRLYETGYGLNLVVIALVSVAVVVTTVLLLREGEPGRVYRVGAVAVVAALVSTAVLPAMSHPQELPTPGVARLAHGELDGRSVPVLVTPQRPGRNLVHFPEGAGEGFTVRASGGPVPALRRPGATGTWAEVDLPEGRSDLVIARAEVEDSVDVDTGTARGLASATGADGPECASAALGSLAAGARDVLAECPSDRLAAEDSDALRKLVGFISDNGARSIAVLADDSARARRAADAVRAAHPDVRVDTALRPGDALLVVSGWESAARSLDIARRQQREAAHYPYGVFLAPWLLHAPITDSVASSFVPLRYDPRDNRSLEYGMTVASSFGGELPSVAGFRQWLSARGQRLTGPVSVYASARVDVMKMSMPGMSDMSMHGSPSVGQWNPSGTVVAVSGVLSE